MIGVRDQHIVLDDGQVRSDQSSQSSSVRNASSTEVAVIWFSYLHAQSVLLSALSLDLLLLRDHLSFLQSP